MIHGCVAGVKTLFCSQLLLGVPLYMGALLCREMLGDGEPGTDGFRTVGRSFFTMYRCFLAGECYSEYGTPIFLQVIDAYGGSWGIFYYLMSACMSFGMANVIVAIFVESTVASAKNNEQRLKQLRLADRRSFSKLVMKLMELLWAHHPQNLSGCSIADLGEDELATLEITPSLFSEVQQSPEFGQLLSSMDIAHEDQMDLFETLDIDGSGTLDLEELVLGLEKMRGDARRSDIVSVNLLLRAMSEDLLDAHEDLSNQLARFYKTPCG